MRAWPPRSWTAGAAGQRVWHGRRRLCLVPCPRQDPSGAAAPNPYVRIAVMGLMLSAILLAPILIGCEVFGFDNLPMFFIACVVAYLFNMDKSIYALQERA